MRNELNELNETIKIKPTSAEPSWHKALKIELGQAAMFHKNLAEFTTIKTGGHAECLVHPESIQDLSRTYAIAQKHHIPVTILGKGSNILVSDEGVSGIVIRLVSPAFTSIERLPGDRIRVGAGVLKSDLLQWSIREGLEGLVFSSGIPGDIGGAMKMNAGTKYGCYADILESVELFRPATGAIEVVSRARELSAYRHQSYIGDGIVTHVTLQLKPGNAVELEREMHRIIAERAAKQPLEWPNFGSTFKNPDHPISAGRMIEQAGLKQTRIGGAEVSEKHANFTLNRGHATATDIVNVMVFVQKRVYEKFGVILEPEVQLVGKFPVLPSGVTTEN